MSYRKKLIEVALPLNAINEASASEKKPIRPGHPSAMHIWWARRPLASCRAVLFASLIDDPSEHPEQFPTQTDQDDERERLFNLMREFTKWENSNNEDIVSKVRAEISKLGKDNLPSVLDPFAGGGSIPLEAQRLGLEVYASDLNPVAVLINKALVEIPPKFAGKSPVNPEVNKTLMASTWYGSQGLAEDVRYYIKWMLNEAKQRIGHLYPQVTLSKEYGNDEATVIAWLWARTVKCSNPICGAQMPLMNSFWLSKKKNKATWIEPEIDHSVIPPIVNFVVKKGQGQPPKSPKVGRGAQFSCLCCGNVASELYVKEEGKNARMGAKLLAIVAEGKGERIYLPGSPFQENIVSHAIPEWKPEQEISENARWFSPPLYGMSTFGDIFTPRQLVALTTLSNLVQEARSKIIADAHNADWPADSISLDNGGTGITAYADAVATYLAFAVDRGANYWSSICSWDAVLQKIRNTFARQSIPMVWDFAEANPFSNSTGSFQSSINWVADVVAQSPCHTPSKVCQQDATTITNEMRSMVSTDPPYYDNIGYADLSDFFYVWLRRSLGKIYPSLFGTVLVPKLSELIATPYRFGGSKRKAQQFFETGLAKAFERMREIQHLDYPLTIYYAFKQAESEATENVVSGLSSNSESSNVIASTGWETMLEGLIHSGFMITGTWPVRTEMLHRSVSLGTNALASSIVLVCRPRPVDAPIATRRELLGALRRELPEALRKLQHGSVAPVDLAQASIGPGMSIYSRYSQVVESDGTPLRVRAALQMINQELDAALAEQEGEYDNETRWAIAWFEQFGMQEGEYGMAETLSKAKNMSVARLEQSGLVLSRAGKVRLRRREELTGEWTAQGSTVWEVAQRMIYALLEGKGELGGEVGTANILRQALALSESVRDLLYRLYTVCERKGWAKEALAYNGLVTVWTRITDLAHRKSAEAQQVTLL